MSRSPRLIHLALAALQAAGLATACSSGGPITSEPGNSSGTGTNQMKPGGSNNTPGTGTGTGSNPGSGGSSTDPTTTNTPPAPNPPATTGGGGGSQQPPAAGGTFAIKLLLDETITMPIVGASDTQFTILGKVSTAVAGGGLAETLEFCNFATQASGGVTITLPPTFAKGFPPLTSPAMISGTMVSTPDAVVVAGWTAANPKSDQLPSTGTDTRLKDPDNDGHPGLTAQTSGLIQADVYLAIRSATALTGSVGSNGKISGQAKGLVEMSIVGASNGLIPDGVLPVTAGPPEKNTFVMVPLDASKGCSDIVAGAAQLFQ